MGKKSIAAMTAALVAGSLLTGVPNAGAQATERGPDASPQPAGSARVPGVDLDTVTIPELQARMADGSLTSSTLTRAYLRRIETVDPKIHSVLRTSPTALRAAAASDARHRRGKVLGPLDGIPVLLKDNVNTRDMPTTAGSLALAGSPPDTDAVLVSRLRKAGAVILGKTNLSEWANFRSGKPTSGWSAVGGQTNNPYVLDRNPCGSSSGSAAALAASLAQVAIGTETDGSIVCPAGMNGVVGHKPSLGLVSPSGVVPISAEQDTAGPMARNVIDTALTLEVLSDHQGSRGDAARSGGQKALPGPRSRPGASGLQDTAAGQVAGRPAGQAASGLRGKRIGLWRLASLGPDVDAVMTRTATKLRKAGAVVVEVTPPYQARLAELEFPALLSEFHRDIDAYLGTRKGPRNLAELIEFNRTHPEEQTCFAGQELFEKALAAPPTTDPGYKAMRAELTNLSRRSLDETLAAHHLDAIAAPTNPPAWTTDCARGDNDVIPSSTPAAVAGYPSLSVPAGSVNELPVGLLLMAGSHQDAELLSLGAAVEHRLKAWRAPRYLPTIGSGAAR
ncbi:MULTISPECIES: amidase family protein [Streptomyces]|uniref:amidase family protein n=1 Tax=Streptomyces TaxID=1883 RepID=UPI001E3465A5|nr:MULTISPECIES: amidase family protein [Streptomyces]UFQ19823.1 amidase [Streptomyces huasconensis]WCL89446.1 amidase family protein [Streptomyces sp. JCM 35825]